MKKTIAIICGGDTSEHDVSMRSAAGIESFLDKDRYIIYKVEMCHGKWEAILADGSRTPVEFLAQLHMMNPARSLMGAVLELLSVY